MVNQKHGHRFGFGQGEPRSTAGCQCRTTGLQGQLRQWVAALEARLNTRGSPGMPGNKSPSDRQAPKKETRKRRPHGFARVRMAPTHRVEHAPAACPECGTGLVGVWVQRTREVIEIPVIPIQATEHVFVARVCPRCEQRRVPKADLKDGVAGRQRLGINLVSLIATLREEGRLPIRTIPGRSNDI